MEHPLKTFKQFKKEIVPDKHKHFLIKMLERQLTESQTAAFCMPFYNYTKSLSELTNTKSVCRTTSKLLSSWSIFKHFSAVFKLNTLSCEVIPLTQQSSLFSNRITNLKSKMAKLGSLEEDTQAFIESETGWDRLTRELDVNPYTGQISQNLYYYTATGISTVGILSMYGCLEGFQYGQHEFTSRYKLSMFATKGAAHKARNQIRMRYALKYLIKYGFIAFIIFTPALSIERGLTIYRNTSSPLHMAAACGTMGMCYKISLGPKGMFAGGVIGGVIGLINGTILYAILKCVGETQEEINYRTVKQMIVTQRLNSAPPPVEYTEEVDVVD